MIHIGTLDIGQALELNLQFLRHIVRVLQAVGRIHDNVDFNNEAWTTVVRADCVNGADFWGMCHGCDAISVKLGTRSFVME